MEYLGPESLVAVVAQPHTPSPTGVSRTRASPTAAVQATLAEGPCSPALTPPPPHRHIHRALGSPGPLRTEDTSSSSLRGPTQGLHLFIGSAPPSDQHHVETGKADDRDEEEASHTHDSHAGPLRPTAVGEDMEQVPVDKLPTQGEQPTLRGFSGS